jgi:20S proteasome subunit alpha 3
MEAINNAGTCVGLRCEEGIVLAAEKRTVSKLLAPSKTSEKTATLDNHLVCLLAGLTADASILINRVRVNSQQYLYTYQQPMPVEQVVKSVCNYKQSYTQFGGLRPFGVAFLFAGWDKHYGFQLYQSDPSGNYSGWKATVIGQNNQAGKSILKTDFKEEEGTIESNLKLAVKILLKTMDSATPSPERIELSSIRKNPNDPSKVDHYTLDATEVEALIKEIKEAEEAETKKNEAASGDI